MHDKIIEQIQAFVRENHPLRAIEALRLLNDGIASPTERTEAMVDARELLRDGMRTGNRHTLEAAVAMLRKDDPPAPAKAPPKAPAKTKAPAKKGTKRGKSKRRAKKARG